MSNYWVQTYVEPVGAALVISGANTAVKAWGFPVDVKRLIFVTTTAVTVANATLTVGKRNVDDTGSVTHGTVVIPFTGSALNDVQYADIGKASETAEAGTVPSQADGSTESIVYTGDPDLLKVNPGEELFVTSDGGATAGAVQIYAEYAYQGNNLDRFGATELTFTAA